MKNMGYKIVNTINMTTQFTKARMVAIFTLLLMTTAAIRADTFYVSPGEDIQAVIDGAGDGDIVLLQPGTYTLSSQISITNGIMMGSVASRPKTIIDGNNATRCLYINHVNCVIDDLTITRGYTTNQSGAGVYCSSGVIQNCLITSNVLSQSGDGYAGGGAYCTESAMLTNCVVRGNSASYGGGVYCEGQSMIQDCWIGYNTAINYGGGVYCRATVQDCMIVSNSAYHGGGVYCSQGIVKDSTISGNSVSGNGGGIYCRSRVSNCTIVKNTAGLQAGGSYCYSSGRAIYCMIYSNSAPRDANWGSRVDMWGSSGQYQYCGSDPAPLGIENMLILEFNEVDSRMDLMPVADEGYILNYWAVDGLYAGTNIPLSLVVEPPLRVEPIFVPVISCVTQSFETASGTNYSAGWI